MLDSYKNVAVSNGTHRTEDLAYALYEPIRALRQESYKQGDTTCYLAALVLSADLKSICNFYNWHIRFNLDIEEPEEFRDVIIEAFDTLDRYAPEGYYFGALEGDGACFGFWELSNIEYEDSI